MTQCGIFLQFKLGHDLVGETFEQTFREGSWKSSLPDHSKTRPLVSQEITSNILALEEILQNIGFAFVSLVLNWLGKF